MYAIIADGGRQYKVEEGQEIDVDYRDVASGSALKFDKIVAVGGGKEPKFGAKALKGASVSAEVVGVAMGPKLVVQKLRRRKTLRRRTGHRQLLTRVKITKIIGA